MRPRNFFWPLLAIVFACIITTLAMVGWSAVVGIGMLATTMGPMFIIPLVVLAAVAVCGLVFIWSGFSRSVGDR